MLRYAAVMKSRRTGPKVFFYFLFFKEPERSHYSPYFFLLFYFYRCGFLGCYFLFLFLFWVCVLASPSLLFLMIWISTAGNQKILSHPGVGGTAQPIESIHFGRLEIKFFFFFFLKRKDTKFHAHSFSWMISTLPRDL